MGFTLIGIILNSNKWQGGRARDSDPTTPPFT